MSNAKKLAQLSNPALEGQGGSNKSSSSASCEDFNVENLMGGPYKFLSELGFCGLCCRSLFFSKKSPVKRAVSSFKLFLLVLIQTEIVNGQSKI